MPMSSGISNGSPAAILPTKGILIIFSLLIWLFIIPLDLLDLTSRWPFFLRASIL